VVRDCSRDYLVWFWRVTFLDYDESPHQLLLPPLAFVHRQRTELIRMKSSRSGGSRGHCFAIQPTPSTCSAGIKYGGLAGSDGSLGRAKRNAHGGSIQRRDSRFGRHMAIADAHKRLNRFIGRFERDPVHVANLTGRGNGRPVRMHRPGLDVCRIGLLISSRPP
jgi:hypothetical protein